jgi:hypothetical protein
VQHDGAGEANGCADGCCAADAQPTATPAVAAAPVGEPKSAAGAPAPPHGGVMGNVTNKPFVPNRRPARSAPSSGSTRGWTN